MIRKLQIILVLISCTAIGKGQKSELTALSDIIAHSDKFEGKIVETEGKLIVEFEHQVLAVPNPPSVQIAKNGNEIWIEFKSTPTNPISNLSGHQVKVKAVVSSKKKGHLGQYSGTLQILELKDLDQKN